MKSKQFFQAAHISLLVHYAVFIYITTEKKLQFFFLLLRHVCVCVCMCMAYNIIFYCGKIIFLSVTGEWKIRRPHDLLAATSIFWSIIDFFARIVLNFFLLVNHITKRHNMRKYRNNVYTCVDTIFSFNTLHNIIYTGLSVIAISLTCIAFVCLVLLFIDWQRK